MSDVTISQINVLRRVFSECEGIRCWCLSNGKIPYDFGRGLKLTWSDHDLLLTFHEAVALLHSPITSGAGIGIGLFLGIDNVVCCMDLDHSLKDGFPANEEICRVADNAGSYTEISVSGTGLHIFFKMQESAKHFPLRKDFCDGVFYTSDRFVRLTGNLYENREYPLRTLTPTNIEFLREKYGVKQKKIASTYTPDPAKPITSLSARLHQAGVPFQPIEWVRLKDHHAEHGGVVEAVELECPNKASHTQDRNHTALFYQCRDGFIGGRCWHDGCSYDTLSEKGMSLTKMLFQNVRDGRKAAGRKFMDTMKVTT